MAERWALMLVCTYIKIKKIKSKKKVLSNMLKSAKIRFFSWKNVI